MADVSVVAGGELKQRVLDDALASALKRAGVGRLSDLENTHVNVDLGGATWFDLGGMLWSVPVLSRLRSQGNSLTLRLPERDRNSTTENLWSFLLRWRYFETLRECVDNPANLLPQDQHRFLTREGRYARGRGVDEDGEEAEFFVRGRMETTVVSVDGTRRSTRETIDGVIDGYGDVLLRATLKHYCGWSSELVDSFVTAILPSTVRNLQHSRGAWGLVATRIDVKNLTLAVADNGVGIPNLLRETLEADLRDVDGDKDSDLIKYFAGRGLIENAIGLSIRDSELVAAAAERGVTSLRDPERVRGRGLFYLKRDVLASGGEMRIRSGGAEVVFDARAAHPRDDLVSTPGTTIRVLLPIKAPRS